MPLTSRDWPVTQEESEEAKKRTEPAISSGCGMRPRGMFATTRARASSLLISSFYENLARGGASRAHALRNAQLGLLRDPVYRHPGYWSPFLLIGSWL